MRLLFVRVVVLTSTLPGNIDIARLCRYYDQLRDKSPSKGYYRIDQTYRDIPEAKALSKLNEELVASFSGTQCNQPRVLYHYTSLSGLQGMISGGSIWVSDLAYMNDTSELSYATSLISDELARAALEASEPLRELLRRAEHPTHPTDAAAGYLAACFCGDGDLLSQWRAYGDGGKGYSIGFDAFRFPSQDRLLRKVIYDPEEQKSLIRDTVSRVAALFLKIAAGRSIADLDEDRTLPAFSAFISSFLSEYSFAFKHSAFKEEAEWRLIIPFMRDELLASMKFRPSAGLLIPYAELSFSDGVQLPRLPLLEIIQGPSLYPKLNLKAVHLLLERYGYDHVEVGGSLAPLRS